MNLFITDKTGKVVAILDDSPIVAEENTPLLSARVTERLNDLSELEFTTLTSGDQVLEIMEGRKVVLVDGANHREFVIDKIEDSDGEFPIRTVYAVSSAVELGDILLTEDITPSTNPEVQLKAILKGTGWETYADPSIYSQSIKESVKHLSVLEALFLLQESLNCDIRFGYKVVGNTVSKRQVELYKKQGSDNGKRFEIGKDVSEVKRTVDTSEIKTAILPMGADGKQDENGNDLPPIDISSISWSKANGDPVDKPRGQKLLGDPEALKLYGIRDSQGRMVHRTLFMEMDVDSPAQLISLAWMQLGRYNKPKITYEAKVVDLYRLSNRSEEYEHERVEIGDSVIVKDVNFPQPIETSARVIEIESDLINPEQNEVVIGEAKGTYSSSQSSQAQSVQELQQKAKEAAKQAGKAIEAANGKNTSYFGSDEPSKPMVGDTWHRPHPTKHGEEQMLIFNGHEWDILLDTSETTEMQDSLDEMKDIADKASVQSHEALEAAIKAELEASEASEEAKKAIVDSLGAKEEAKKALANADKALTQAQGAKDETSSLKLTVDSIGKEVALKATKSEVDNVRGTVQEQATKIAQNSKEISAKANQSEVNTLKGTVKEQETKIALNAQGLASKANKSEVDTLNKTVKEQETKLTQTAKEVEVKASKSEVKEISDELQGLEFGGTNLLRDSKLNKKTSDYLIQTIHFGDNPPKEGESYTISIKGKMGSDVTHFPIYNSGGTVQVTSLATRDMNAQGVYTKTFKWKNAENNSHINIYNWPRASTSESEIEWVKLEKGNRPTDWSPAPEDMATGTDIKNVEASMKVQADEIALKASKSEVKLVSDEIKSLEFGGTNLFTGTSNKLKKIVIDGWNHYPNGISYEIEVEEGQKYSAQAYIKSITSNVGVGLRFFWYSKDNKLIRENSSQETPWVNSGKSGYFVIVDTAPSGATGLRVSLRNNSGTGKSTIEYKELKVEKGNRPTDWSPAPEDLAQEIDIKRVEASLKVQSDAINLKADKTELDATNKKVSNNSSTLGVQAGEIKAVSSKVDKTSTELAQVKVTADRVSSEVAKKVDISKVNEAILANERIIDTRTRNDNPNYYYTNYKSRKVREFKNTSTVGLPNDGTYAVVETDVRWSDISGGKVVQTAQTDKATYQRFSANTTTWGVWRRVADVNDISEVKTQITQLADNINARIVEKNKVISQINLSKEGVLIQGKNIHLDGNTKINNGIIKNAHIQDAAITSAKIAQLDAGKITTGELKTIKIVGKSMFMDLSSGEVQFQKGRIFGSNMELNIDKGAFSSKGVPEQSQVKVETIFTNGKISATPQNGNSGNIIMQPFFNQSTTANTLVTNLMLGAGGLRKRTTKVTMFALNNSYGYPSPYDKDVGIIDIDASGAKEGGGIYSSIAIGAREITIGSNATAQIRPSGVINIQADRVHNISTRGASLVLDGEIARIGGAIEDSSTLGTLQMGKDGTGNYVRSKDIYRRTYSSGPHVMVTEYGTLGRITSAAKYKLLIEENERLIENAKRVLHITPKSWFDKKEVESIAQMYNDGGMTELEPDIKATRHFGFVADDFHEQGLTEVVQYDEDGEVDGLAYDRVPMYHNVVLREHEEQINMMQAQIDELIERLGQLS